MKRTLLIISVFMLSLILTSTSDVLAQTNNELSRERESKLNSRIELFLEKRNDVMNSNERTSLNDHKEIDNTYEKILDIDNEKLSVFLEKYDLLKKQNYEATQTSTIVVNEDITKTLEQDVLGNNVIRVKHFIEGKDTISGITFADHSFFEINYTFVFDKDNDRLIDYYSDDSSEKVLINEDMDEMIKLNIQEMEKRNSEAEAVMKQSGKIWGTRKLSHYVVWYKIEEQIIGEESWKKE